MCHRHGISQQGASSESLKQHDEGFCWSHVDQERVGFQQNRTTVRTNLDQQLRSGFMKGSELVKKRPRIQLTQQKHCDTNCVLVSWVGPEWRTISQTIMQLVKSFWTRYVGCAGPRLFSPRTSFGFIVSHFCCWWHNGLLCRVQHPTSQTQTSPLFAKTHAKVKHLLS